MLECILYGKIIVQNDNPKHYSVCSKCDINDLTDKQKKFIEMGIKLKVVKIDIKHLPKEISYLKKLEHIHFQATKI